MKTNLSLNSVLAKIAFALSFAVISSTSLMGATLIVRSDGSGSYTTISSAVTAASSGDILDIDGTFTGDGASSTGIVINKNLTLTGHGVDSTIVQATTSAYNTAINKRVFTISAGYTVTIQNLTVRYGYISTGTNYDGGGGIKNSGTLTLTGCTVTQNGTYSSSNQAGAGLLDDGSATLTANNCTFSYNKATGSSGWGGGIMHGNYGTPGILTVKNCTFNNNTVTGRSGAIYILITSSTNIITNSTFYANQSGDYGGAVFNDRSNTIFTNNTFVNNVNTSGTGGALACYANTSYLKNNLLAHNKQSTTTANDLYFQSATITDNGHNLVENSSGYTFSGTGDITGTQSSLNVDTGLTSNGVSGVPLTLGLLSGSVAIDAGSSGSNSTVTVPCQDERGYYIATTKDIGAFEYNGTTTASYSITITTQPRDTTVCVGSSLTLTVATSNGTTYQWRKNGTNMAGKTSSSLTFASIAAIDSASYDCVISDNCVSGTSYAAKLTVNLGPAITTTPGAHCGTGTVTLSASSSGTYNWYAAASGGSSLGTNSAYTTPSISSTTTYYVSATLSGCASARTPVVATIGTGAPSITGTTPASVCDSGAMSLGATTSAGTINWYAASSGGSSLGTGSSFTTPIVSSTTTYYVDATSNGCTTASRTAVAATVNATPAITGTTPASVCDSGTVSLSATASAGAINWYTASTGGSSQGTGTSFTTPKITSTTTYYVDATSNGCTTSSRISVTATINASPVASMTCSGPTAFCSGDSRTLSASAGADYLWSSGETTSSIIVTSTGVYGVTVTGTNGCSATSSLIGLVSYATGVLASTTDGSACGTDTVTLSASASDGTINWYADAGGVTWLASGNTFTTPSISSTTTYYVNAMDVCPSAMTAVTATINALPSVSANTTASSMCSGENVTLTGGGASSYSWDNSVTDGLAFTPSATHTYTVTGTDGNICSATATVTVTVNSLPTVSSDTTALSVCLGNSVTLTGSGASSYTWDDSVIDGVAFTPSVSHTYTVTGTDGNSCSATTTVTVTVNPSDSVHLTAQPQDASVCDWIDWIHFIVGSPDSVNYQWQFDGGSGYVNLTEGWPFYGTQTSDLGIAYPMWYQWLSGNHVRCVATGTHTCDIADTSNAATIYLGYSPDITQEANDYSVCGNAATAQFSVTVSDTNVTYQWQLYQNTMSRWINISDDSTYSGTNVATLNISNVGASMDGNQYNCVITSTIAGCTSNSSATLHVDTVPHISANSSTSVVCNGSQVILWGGNGSGFIWNSGVSDSIAFAPGASAMYTITGNDIKGCAASDSIYINLRSVPVATINASGSTSFCSGGSITLSTGIADSYVWSTGETASSIIVSTTGNYSVIETNAATCSDTSSIVTVTVNSLPTVTMSSLPTVGVCNSSFILSGGSPSGGIYSGTGVSSGSFDPAVGVGTYSVTYTYTDNNGCSSTANSNVVVEAAPIVSMSTLSNIGVCNSSFVLTGGSPTGGIYSGIGVTAGSFNPAVGVGTYSVTYTYVDHNGCSASASNDITVDAAPNVTISSLSNVGSCNSSFALSGGSPSGGIYSGTRVVNNHFDPSVGAGTYTVTYTYTDHYGCGNSDSTTIQVVGATAVSAGTYSKIGICNSLVSLTRGTPSGGIYSGAGVSSNQFNPSIGAGAHSITYSYTDTYGCSTSDSAIITVAALPVVTFSSLPDVGVCQSSLALTGGSPLGGVYSGTTVSSGYFDPSFAGVGTQTLTYTYEDTIYGCSNSATGTINVTGVPSVTSISPASRCDAGSLTLGATASFGIVNWFADSTGNSILNTGTLFITPGISSSTTYYAEAALNSCPSHRSGVRAVINQSASRTISANICSGDQFTIGSNSFNTTGIHTAILSTMNGCDSTITLQLTVGTPITDSQTLILCAGESITVGSHTYNTSGNYTDEFTAASGCDSTVTTNLTVNPSIDVTTSVSGSTITANATSASYQWLNCSSGNSIIPGQTNQSFAVTANGDYAVIVTINNCSDTSSCVSMIATGINTSSVNYSLSVYPNPSNGVFTIKAPGEIVYSILDEIGQTIRKGRLNSENNYTIDVKDLSSGIYYVVGQNEHTTTKQKVVVVK